jgi:hypothetical protein
VVDFTSTGYLLRHATSTAVANTMIYMINMYIAASFSSQ